MPGGEVYIRYLEISRPNLPLIEPLLLREICTFPSFEPALVPMPVIFSATSLLRVQLDQRINPHDRYASLHRTLQLLHLAHTRL